MKASKKKPISQSTAEKASRMLTYSVEPQPSRTPKVIFADEKHAHLRPAVPMSQTFRHPITLLMQPRDTSVPKVLKNVLLSAIHLLLSPKSSTQVTVVTNL